MMRKILQIKSAIEDLRPPNPHFMYADIGNRLARLANGRDGVLEVLERHLSESIDRILSEIDEVEKNAFELELELRKERERASTYLKIAQMKEENLKDRHHKNLIEIKKLIQRIDPPGMATEQSVGTQVYSLLDRFLAEFEPNKINQEET